jgi:hypothetical protein
MQIVPQTAPQVIKHTDLRLTVEVFGDIPTDETGASRN